MIYYTDCEIYKSIKRGVEIKTLAQLNGCKEKDIKAAFDRYEAKLLRSELEYKKILDDRKANAAGIEKYSSSAPDVTSFNSKSDNRAINSIKGESDSMDTTTKAPRFKYSEETLDKMKQRAKINYPVELAYEELFGEADEKPNIQAFKKKYKGLQANLPTASLQGISNQDRTISQDNLKMLQASIVRCQDTITESYNKAISELNALYMIVSEALS